MTDTITSEELLTLRMRALGLDAASRSAAASSEAAGPDRVAAIARRMLALQGQDWRSSRWALGVRDPGVTLADVHEAFNTGKIVRSWPMRGTVHVVAAEDIGWMQRATNHRVLAGAPKRRDFLGMSDADLDRLVEVSLQALGGAGRTGLDRTGLAEAWTEAGIDWKSNWRYHIIWWLCQNGYATFGPVAEDGGEPRLVLASDWIRGSRDLDGDDALVQLATRYAAGRGPVREKDLAWWSGLTIKEVRRGIELATEAELLAPLRLEGARGVSGALWVDPELLGRGLGSAAVEPTSAPHASPVSDAGSGSDAGTRPLAPADTESASPDADWLLLPAFDEHLLGYTNRDAQLDPAHFERIVPGRNGMFLGTAVVNGRVAGTWKRSTRKSGGVEVTALPGCFVDAAALTPETARWSCFHGAAPGPVQLADAGGPLA
ncbi:MAG: winged helix DNA-binding domain-containing protein [Leucobacter sp.]